MSRPKDLPIQEWERRAGKCNWEIKHGDPTTRCQERPTTIVYGLDGNRIKDRLCKQHAKDWYKLILGVNGYITGAIIGKN